VRLVLVRASGGGPEGLRQIRCSGSVATPDVMWKVLDRLVPVFCGVVAPAVAQKRNPSDAAEGGTENIDVESRFRGRAGETVIRRWRLRLKLVCRSAPWRDGRVRREPRAGPGASGGVEGAMLENACPAGPRRQQTLHAAGCQQRPAPRKSSGLGVHLRSLLRHRPEMGDGRPVVGLHGVAEAGTVAIVRKKGVRRRGTAPTDGLPFCMQYTNCGAFGGGGRRR